MGFQDGIEFSDDYEALCKKNSHFSWKEAYEM